MCGAVHAGLSISMQNRLLSINRSSFYYAPQPEYDEMLAMMLVIDAGDRCDRSSTCPDIDIGNWCAI